MRRFLKPLRWLFGRLATSKPEASPELPATVRPITREAAIELATVYMNCWDSPQGGDNLEIIAGKFLEPKNGRENIRYFMSAALQRLCDDLDKYENSRTAYPRICQQIAVVLRLCDVAGVKLHQPDGHDLAEIMRHDPEVAAVRFIM